MFQIWCEGYQANGDSSGANLLATVYADSFREACIKHFKNDKLFNEENLTYWGCRLYDNRIDAQKTFG